MAWVERARDEMDAEIDGIVGEIEDTEASRIFETIRTICYVFNTVASCFAGIRGQSRRSPAATQPTHQVYAPPALPTLLLQAADGTVMAVPVHFPPGVTPHPSPVVV